MINNRAVKFSAVLDWIICQSKFITMPCWNIVSTTNILAVQCFDIHTQPVNCKFVFAVYWHGPVGVYGAEFPRHLGAKPQIYDNETLDLINLLWVLPSGIYVCSFSLYVKVIHLKYNKNILMLWHTK